MYMHYSSITVIWSPGSTKFGLCSCQLCIFSFSLISISPSIFSLSHSITWTQSFPSRTFLLSLHLSSFHFVVHIWKPMRRYPFLDPQRMFIDLFTLSFHPVNLVFLHSSLLSFSLLSKHFFPLKTKLLSDKHLTIQYFRFIFGYYLINSYVVQWCFDIDVFCIVFFYIFIYM